jgi:hypothetical protein
VQAAVSVPVDPLHRGVFDVVDGVRRAGAKWAAWPDGFCLEQPERSLGQSVVVGIPNTADRCRDSCQHKGFGESDRRVLRPGITVMDQSVTHPAVGVIAAPQRHLERGGHQRVVLHTHASQPTMAREKQSITSATYTKPAQLLV